jgi:hypothetical protein
MWKSLKRWPVLLALLVVLGGLAVGLICLPYRNRVTLANCERIKRGMTEAEVRAILGKPWDDSWLDPDPPEYGIGLQKNDAWLKYSRQWVGDDCEIIVIFDDEDRVVVSVPHNIDRPHSSLPARVYRRLRKRLGW